jgi:hypothetical protein
MIRIKTYSRVPTYNKSHQIGGHVGSGLESDCFQGGILGVGDAAQLRHVGENCPVLRGRDPQVKGRLDRRLVPAGKCLPAKWN